MSSKVARTTEPHRANEPAPIASDTPAASRWLALLDGARTRAVLVVALFTAAAVFAYGELDTVSWHGVRAAFAATSAAQLATAVLAAAASYVVLTGYDFLALRYLGAKVPPAIVALTSFVSQAFTFNLGFGVLTGGAVRLRLYGAAGLKPDAIVATSLFASFAFWLALAGVAGVALILAPAIAETALGLASGWATAAGLLLTLGVAGTATALAVLRPQLPAFDRPAPGPLLMGAALLIGAADILASAAALWALLPASTEQPFFQFLVVFAVATAAGVVSHVPGGLGIFEGVILLGTPDTENSALLAALLLFRVIYYLVPMAIAGALLLIVEARAQRSGLARGLSAVGAAVGSGIPALSASLTMLGGFILLASGALPAEHDRMAVLRHAVPLPFVEASHFIASIAGALLLIIAHGLARRLEGAWRAALALLVIAATFSLLKGIDYEEAIVCLGIAALLLAGKPWFYRRGGAFSGPLQASEIVSLGLAVGTSVLLGLMSFRHVAYHDSLWWDFRYHGDASRFMRATLGIATTVLLVTAYRLINRPGDVAEPTSPADIADATRVASASPKVEANLALTGDKQLLFNEARDGLVMYAVQGSSWIAMGDPIAASPKDAAALVWLFREEADRHAGAPVFYQVTSEHLPLYLDAGFSMMKLGEEAWVDLEQFTLDGSEGRKLRQSYSKAKRSGAELAIVPAAEVASYLSELKAVSEAWLDDRGGREKGFSLGFWSDGYMTRNDVAIIRHEGHVVAFANIWRSADRHEMSVDLMRAHPKAPPSMMELLFIGLMEHAKAEGFRWFNLGMAPLSGLPQHRLAPLWSRFATWFSRHGDRFYNFEGLRAFKSKFHPEWRPKYLAYPRGRLLPQVLVDVATLVANAPRRAKETSEV